MKDIKHVQILGNKHPIKFLDAPLVKGKGKKADFRWGEIDEGKNGTIYIYRGSSYIIMDTFFHEALHSIFDSLGRTDLSCDESLVSRLSLTLTDMMMQNKPLPPWLAELAKKGL